METKKIKMPFGVPGHNLGEVEREIPANEPPAWPINEKLKHVGRPVRRYDALAKVTGKAKFTADVQLPGMLYAKFFNATTPSAKILSIDTSKAEALEGVYAIHILKDDQGNYSEVKYVGQPIGAVAAVSLEVAEEAASKVSIEYQYEKFVIDAEEALKPESPIVHRAKVEVKADGGDVGVVHDAATTKGNVVGPTTGSFYGGPRGDIEAGFKSANVIVEHTYRTQVQTHVPLETHGVVVDWKPGSMTVYASTQSTVSFRDELSEYFEIPKSEVRVISEYTGGGFGAKHSAGIYGPMAALLSKKTGRPVWLMHDRKEEHVSQGNRPNSIQYLKIGAKKNGELTAIQQKSHGTAGVSLGAGVGNIAQVMYECPNFTTEQYDVYTNGGPGAAWRAPGNVQGAFALEQAIDELAHKLGMDPLAYRDLIDKSEIRKIERKQGAEKFGWSRRTAPGTGKGAIKKGFGVAQASWPRFVTLDSSAEVRLLQGGGVEIRSSVQDIGTGTKTVLAQVVAEELGIEVEQVTVLIGDTYFPVGPASGGSVVTGSITPPARNAAYKAKLELLEQVAIKLKSKAENLEIRDSKIIDKTDPAKAMNFKEALTGMRTSQIIAVASRSDDYGGFEQPWGLAYGHLGSVQFAEISVDTETGFIKVDKIVAAHSCGRPINIAQVQSQINGGIIQGISYALYEYRSMDKATGFMMNANVDQYKMPYSMEIPEIETIVIEDYAGRSSTDAYGIGEPANIATAVAVANAVYNAIGVRIYELPITPDKVLKALKKI
ncbi:MAG: xanthine dehydrogenase family protein molybdopterin-binding subunit [Cyclobacteriaceae bacterium]|nr:xanthine dehydrogenase family protein molybdopterin-binding subunit [Cyclobacteriaceae bacterium]